MLFLKHLVNILHFISILLSPNILLFEIECNLSSKVPNFRTPQFKFLTFWPQNFFPCTSSWPRKSCSHVHRKQRRQLFHHTKVQYQKEQTTNKDKITVSNYQIIESCGVRWDHSSSSNMFTVTLTWNLLTHLSPVANRRCFLCVFLFRFSSVWVWGWMEVKHNFFWLFFLFVFVKKCAKNSQLDLQARRTRVFWLYPPEPTRLKASQNKYFCERPKDWGKDCWGWVHFLTPEDGLPTFQGLVRSLPQGHEKLVVGQRNFSGLFVAKYSLIHCGESARQSSNQVWKQLLDNVQCCVFWATFQTCLDPWVQRMFLLEILKKFYKFLRHGTQVGGLPWELACNTSVLQCLEQ